MTEATKIAICRFVAKGIVVWSFCTALFMLPVFAVLVAIETGWNAYALLAAATCAGVAMILSPKTSPTVLCREIDEIRA